MVTNAQGLPCPPGGSAADGKQSRYALIDNILSQTFRPLRRCYYEYHRIGLDVAFDDLAAARQVMADALISLRNVHRIRPANYNLQTFFQAKKDEIVKMFGVAPKANARLLPVLKLIDPGNIPVYDQDSADAPSPRHPELRPHRPHRMGCGPRVDGADRRNGQRKSILLGALGLVLGDRAEGVDTGEGKCIVEAEFMRSEAARACSGRWMKATRAFCGAASARRALPRLRQ